MTSFEEDGSFLELMAELSLLERLKSHGVEHLMSKIQTMLCNSEVTADAQCTASADSVCWLLDSLDRWNAILYRCGFGLREEEPGSLTCITLDVHKEGEHLVHDEGILEAMCFFYQLFRLHHCVCRLTIGNVDSLRSLWYWLPVLQLSLVVSRELHSLEVVSLPDERGRCRVLEAAAEIATLQELKCTTKFLSKSSLCRMLQPSGHRLTELVLIFGEAELSAGGFFGFLGSCSSLKILRLDGNEISDIGPLFSLMASNRTIVHLSLKLLNGDMNYIEEGIASVLRRNVVLKQLELSLYDSNASLIAESLEVNTALDSISLEGFCITDMSPFARMLRTNRTLRKLSLARVRSDDDIPSLVEAIRSNETLAELCIWGSSTLDRSLVEALRYNSTLEFLRLRQISASSDQGRLMQAALEPWALERLTAVWDGGCCFDLARALQSGAAMSSLNLFYENNHGSPTFHGLREVFEALALNQTVKSLSLRMGASDLVPRSVTHKLCLALASNNALESLSLWIKDRKDVATLQLICEGLSQNSHVRILRITVSGSDPAALQHMGTLLGRNNSITSLDFQAQVEFILDFNLPKSLSKEWRAECRVLAEAISRNDYLLEAHVDVKDYYCSVNYTPDLTLTVLRNLSSVRRAVRFALTPSTDKQAAATFQKYHRSPVLFHKLKEAKTMSDKEAASLVRSAANFIARHFFIVTAVVKRTLQCERAQTAALQLTDLNEACLLKGIAMGSVEHNEPFHDFIACIRSHQDYMKPCNVEYHINKVKAELHENGADIDASCSANPGCSACWLLDSLDPWNAILFQGGIGLYEDKLGSLACITFQLSYSEVYGDEGHMLESACVFYRLFSSHFCLQRLVLSDAYPLLKEIYWPALLKLSLEVAKGLHSIDVVSSLDREGRCSVLDAAPNVSTIREVACTIKPRIPDYLHETLRVNGCHLTSLKLGCAAVTAESLFTSLKFCSCLRLLELSSLKMDVAVFIDFMANNRTVTHLILSEVSSGTGNVEDGVASVLEKNTPLEVLELSMRGGDATHIADSLCTNSTLQILSLENFGNLAIEQFSRVLTVNETLIELCLSAYFSYVDAGSLVEGILSNRTLKHLHISTKHAESILRLVEALRLNTTLCSLHVDDISTHEEEQRLVEVAALQPWALERLVTTWYGHCCRDLARTISIGANPTSLEVLYPMYQNLHKYDGLVELLTSLRSNESVTSFSLTGYHPFGEIVSRHLGRLFACNKALEVVQISTLCLEDYDDESHLQLLCEGLVRNSSIHSLQLVFIESKPNFLKHLAVVVEKNRHLTCLELDIEVLVDRDDDELLFVVAEWMQACTLFSNAIKTNRYLLKANLRVFASYSIIEFASDYRLTVQRNLCALNRASRFVLAPAANKRAAEVFQEYERSPGLIRVLRETEKISDLDVVRMVRSASTFIACHFFVVAGVVKERVQCEANGKTGLQLGDLDEVCMLKIVSYLKVCDVVS